MGFGRAYTSYEPDSKTKFWHHSSHPTGATNFLLLYWMQSVALEEAKDEVSGIIQAIEQGRPISCCLLGCKVLHSKPRGSNEDSLFSFFVADPVRLNRKED